jgi:hypothetical protein
LPGIITCFLCRNGLIRVCFPARGSREGANPKLVRTWYEANPKEVYAFLEFCAWEVFFARHRFYVVVVLYNASWLAYKIIYGDMGEGGLYAGVDVFHQPNFKLIIRVHFYKSGNSITYMPAFKHQPLGVKNP